MIKNHRRNTRLVWALAAGIASAISTILAQTQSSAPAPGSSYFSSRHAEWPAFPANILDLKIAPLDSSGTRWLLDDTAVDYNKINEDAQAMAAAEEALGMSAESGGAGGAYGPLSLQGDCGGHLISPQLQNSNAILTIVEGTTNAVHDLFMLHTLNNSNTWTFVARGTNGQSVFVVSNVPPDQSYFTVCCTNDSDCDGISDCAEVLLYHTDPSNADSDYDSRSDSEELAEGTDPLNPNSFTPVRLATFRFNEATWLGTRSQVPIIASNLHLVDAWITKAVELNTNGAILKYRDVECPAAANINLRAGTIRMWLKPQWNSGASGGPGSAAKLLEVGSKGATVTNGWFSLFFDAKGTNLLFATQTNDLPATTNLTATVSLVSNQWVQISLTYTNGSIAIYTNGVLAASSTNTLQYPGLAQRQTGFSVGSSADGNDGQVMGAIEDLETFNYPLCDSDILENFQLTQPPNLIPNLRMWLKADAGVIKTGDKVNQWSDQSGNANHATQTPGPDQPFYVTNGISSNPAIYFPGTNNYLNITSSLFNNATQAEAFMLLKADSALPTTNRGLWYLGPQGSRYPNTDGTVADSYGSLGIVNTPVPGVAIDQPHIYNVVARSNEWTCSFNGVAHFSRNNNTLRFNDTTLWLGNGAGGYFAGHIGEMLVFSRALSDTERFAVESYLSQRYNLVTNPPPVPANLTVLAVSTSQISLTWSNALSNTNVGFIVQRKADGGCYANAAIVRNALSFLDSDLASGTQYFYRITAVNYSGEWALPVETNATTLSSGATIPLASLKLWLKADCGHGYGPLNCWLDQTTNNNSALFLSSVAVGAPTWTGFNTNGNPAVFFAGTNAFSLPAFLASATQAEAFVAVRSFGPTDTNWVALWLMGGGATPSYYPYTNNYIYDNFGRHITNGATSFNSGLADMAVAHLYNPMSKAGEWKAWVNNVPRYTNTINTPAFQPTACRLGRGDSTISKYLVGDISEVMVFDRELTAGERDIVATNYFRKRFNLW